MPPRKTATTSTGPGPVESGVEAEIGGLASEARPGLAQAALALARIMDNPKAVNQQPAAAGAGRALGQAAFGVGEWSPRRACCGAVDVAWRLLLVRLAQSIILYDLRVTISKRAPDGISADRRRPRNGTSRQGYVPRSTASKSSNECANGVGVTPVWLLKGRSREKMTKRSKPSRTATALHKTT